MPSYSMRVKQNILSSLEMRPGRIKVVILGLTQAMARLVSEEGREKIAYTSENIGLIKFIRAFLDKELGLSTGLSYNKNTVSGSKKRLNLSLSQAEDYLDFLGLNCKSGELDLSIPAYVYKNMRTMRDYMTGFFLASGFMADPKKNYHLEFVCRTEGQAGELIKLLSYFSFDLKKVKRQTSTVVYVKDSSVIADILSIMEATSARLALEDEMIMKQINNNVNRIVNCETANIEKSSEVSVRQVNAIRYIEETMGLSQLDEKLRRAAELRLEHPLLSLRELGLKMKPALGKSGMNHRMSKLEEIALALQKRHGEQTEKEQT